MLLLLFVLPLALAFEPKATMAPSMAPLGATRGPTAVDANFKTFIKSEFSFWNATWTKKETESIAKRSLCGVLEVCRKEEAIIDLKVGKSSVVSFVLIVDTPASLGFASAAGAEMAVVDDLAVATRNGDLEKNMRTWSLRIFGENEYVKVVPEDARALAKVTTIVSPATEEENDIKKKFLLFFVILIVLCGSLGQVLRHKQQIKTSPFEENKKERIPLLHFQEDTRRGGLSDEESESGSPSPICRKDDAVAPSHLSSPFYDAEALL